MRYALVNANRRIRTTRRMLTFLIVTIACGDSLTGSAVAAGDLKFAHHSPLASALNGRAVHDSGGIGISTRGSETNAVNANSASGSGGNGGVGEVLVPKTFPLSAQEPTCEQLRAMWIFSKRQSRAAEITNEIPTYRDPFAYNVWEPYYSSTRSMGSVRMMPHFGERTRSPVYGRVVSREPLLPQRTNIGQRHRHLGGGSELSQTRFYGAESRPPSSASGGRRTSQYRYVGANGSANTVNSGSSNSPVVQGSFQKLKELIWTERAKELTQQRRAEEMAARAAVLKEIANGQNIQAPYKPALKTESYLMDENRSPDRDSYDNMNDDHRSGSIASGQSQAAHYAQKTQSSSNLKNIGTPRSYSSKSQKSGSVFSGNGGGGRGSASRSVMSSSYVPDDVGIPKAYPMRPSHFRERNRSLFKQHTPGDYFLRDSRQGGGNTMHEAESDADPVINNLVLERLVNELNRRIIEKQQQQQQYEDLDPIDEEALQGEITNYDYEPRIMAANQYGEPQEPFADYLN